LARFFEFSVQKSRYFEYAVQKSVANFWGVAGGGSVKVFLGTDCCCQKYLNKTFTILQNFKFSKQPLAVHVIFGLSFETFDYLRNRKQERALLATSDFTRIQALMVRFGIRKSTMLRM